MWVDKTYLLWNKLQHKVDQEDRHLKFSLPLIFMIFCVSVSETPWQCEILQNICANSMVVFGLVSVICTFGFACSFAFLYAHNSDIKHLLQVILNSAAEIALGDTVCDNNRKRDVYCRISTPLNLAQNLHAVPVLPPVHTTVQEVLPAQAGGQKAREVAFVLVREFDLEKLFKWAACKRDCVFS